MSSSPINLDQNSTTPILPEVAEVLREASLKYPGNPASQHTLGRQARQALEEARERIAELLDCNSSGRNPDRVIFTSGGTEANNLALRGALEPMEVQHHEPRSFAISTIEHPSIVETAAALIKHGHSLHRLKVNESGVCDLASVADVLNFKSPPLRIVSLMCVNNETGAIQPVQEVAQFCRTHNVLTQCDAVQAIGKMSVNFRELGVDLLSFTAHKFHGPRGIGALVVRGGVKLAPQLFGGFQQEGTRPGTESVALPIAMCRALELFHEQAAERIAHLKSLQEQFESGLQKIYPHVVINASDAPRAPHTTNAAFVGLDRQALVMALDLAGVACSTGSACASGSSEPSPILLAMGLSNEIVQSSVRFSWGALTTTEEIQAALARIESVLEQAKLKIESR